MGRLQSDLDALVALCLLYAMELDHMYGTDRCWTWMQGKLDRMTPHSALDQEIGLRRILKAMRHRVAEQRERRRD